MRDGRRRGLASAVARRRPRALMAPDLHKLNTKGKALPVVGSAPDARCMRPWLRLPRPADVVDAHAPGVEVDAHAHDVEAQVGWQGAVGCERAAHAERRPVRDHVVVDERLEVMMPRSEGQVSPSRLVPAGFRRRGEDRGSSDNPRRSLGVGNPGDPARLRAAPGFA